ncbi:hypothetical protein BH09PLA1_BH09PLA1_31970 [soil metagenome]
MAYLLISVEGKPSTRRPLDGPTIVGRAVECPVWIDDSRLSRHHCRFEPVTESGGEDWVVIDLSSKNGTLVRGDRISMHKLADRDEVMVGRARLVFHSRSEPPQRPSAPTAPISGPIANSTAKPSPADTLMDSRFPIPQIKPELDVTKTKRPTTKSHRPLPFQRPPAQPKVDGSTDGLFGRIMNWIRRMRSR